MSARIAKIYQKKVGLYFVFEKSSEDLNTPVYIGSATGKTGLYGRIHSQHLNSNYLETRISRSNIKDEFQISCQKTKKNKSGTDVVCIDKSSLRKAIGRNHKVSPGEDTVAYINDNFKILYVTLESADFELELTGELKCFVEHFIGNETSSSAQLVREVSKGMTLSIESILINKMQPMYNTQGKS